ncbi:competence protein CoiA family protein [Lentibacillus sp. N15]|uniref:competence protein CoiA n=1 Tax=Lentibacillus songyuanensis TaxID=3136161 RepID=UPI0031BA68A9
MLQAKTNDGKLITLATLTTSEIAALKTRRQFYCPVCQERVVVKAGTKMVAHFAHLKKENCPSSEGGEGAYHAKGKLMLFEWLQRLRLDVQLEAYLPEIKQRPDLLITIDHKQIAVEYQCARISAKEIRKRNIGYQRLGIQPIWIIGANHFRRLSRHHIKLDHFQCQFLHQFTPQSPLTCYFFSPDTQTLIRFHDIYITGTQQALGKLHFCKLRNMNFLDLFSQDRLSKQKLYSLWVREKSYFRMRPRNQISRKELAWQQWLYLKRTHAEYLPSIIHLPVSAQYRMYSPLWNWQSRICLELLEPLPIGGHISHVTCMHLLRQHIISSADLPLTHSGSDPIQQYLLLLTQFHLLKQESLGHFTKQSHLKFYSNVEEAMKGDKMLLDVLSAKNTAKIQA